MRRFRQLASAAASSLLVVGALVVPAASGGGGPTEEHCVIHVTGKRANGQFETGPETCYPRFSDAMAAVGLQVEPTSRPGDLEAALVADWAIGVHYDGFNGGSSSLTVNGADCTGGWLNLSSTWVNRISSTKNGCGRIRHFDGSNLGGTYEDTYGAGTTDNLGLLNNAVNSIQYFAS